MESNKWYPIIMAISFGVLAFSATYVLFGIFVQPDSIKLMLKNYLERKK